MKKLFTLFLLIVLGSNISSAQAPVAKFTASKDTICAGDTVTFTNTSTGTVDSILWTLGGGSHPDSSIDANPKVPFAAAGYYHVILKVSNTNGSDTVGLTIKVGGGPIPVLPKNPKSCGGSTVILTVPASGSNYTWKPDSTLNIYIGDTVFALPVINTVYIVSGVDSLGCSATGVDSLTVIPLQNNPTIYVSVTGDSLISSADTGNQWYLDCSILKDSTRRILLIRYLNGCFSLTVNTPCGLIGDSCNFCEGINRVFTINQSVKISPNPFNSNLTISINSLAQDVADWNLQVTDLLGQTIYTQSSLNYNNYLSLGDLASGIYFITITNKTDRAVFKAIKQ